MQKITGFLNNLEPKTRFFVIYSLIGLAQIFAILFPIAFILDKILSAFELRRYNPLWFVLDDSRLDNSGLSEDYRIYLEGYKRKWVGVLAWHMVRNRVWNLVDSFPVDNGNPTVGNQDITITRYVKDDLHKLVGTKVPQNGKYVASAVLKFVGKQGDNPWQVNRGDTISIDHSTLGEGEIYYETKNGFKGWRYTSCRLKSIWWLFGAKRWHTEFYGSNSNRYSFKYKFTKVKPWGKWY